MKRTRRLVSILLALAMLLTLAVPAMAATTTKDGQITISGAVDGETYSIYEMLKLESSDTEKGVYSYTLIEPWKEFFISGAGRNYVNIVDEKYVTWKADKSDDADKAAFAAAALEWADDNEVEATQTKPKVKDVNLVFSDLETGYYLVDSSLGAICSLGTPAKEVTIEEKNDKPSVDKEVQEGTAWGDENDANIGDTVNYKATITVTEGAAGIKFHDNMDTGLTLDTSSIKVYNNGTVVTEGVTITMPTPELEDGCDFEISFTDAYIESLWPSKDLVDSTIVIEYSATVNENAVIAGDGNKNTAKIEYGDGNSVESETITKVWDLDVEKYTGNKESPTYLAGATFEVYDNASCTGTAFKFVKEETADGTDVYRYVPASDSTTTGTATSITTGESGKFTIKGLDSGEYWLKETAAPDGYNKLATPIKITIEEGKCYVGDLPAETDTVVWLDKVMVENKTGSELPGTGGIGTTIFYVTGAILVLGAAVLLITKRRVRTEK